MELAEVKIEVPTNTKAKEDPMLIDREEDKSKGVHSNSSNSSRDNM